MDSQIDLSDRIERQEAFEERAGISMEALSAFATWDGELSGGWTVTVRGEAHARAENRIPASIRMLAALYDADGRVVRNLDGEIRAEHFFVFEAFELRASWLPQGTYSRVLVFPVAS